MRPRERIASGIAIATIVVAIMAIGGAPRWGLCLASGVALASVLPLLRSPRGFATPPPLLVFLVAALGITCLQLVPLPAGFVELLSAKTFELIAGAHATLGEAAPSWMAISLDPPGTLLEIVKLVGYVAFAFACLRISTTERGRLRMLTAVALAGTATAIVGLLHAVAGAQSLFGVYTPEMATPTYTAPLLNPNHLAGLLAVTTCLCIGLAVKGRGKIRFLWLAAATISTGTCLLARSRGGAIALVVASVSTCVGLWLQSRRVQARRGQSVGERKQPRSVAIFIAIIAACGMVLVGVFTAGGVAQELAGTSRGELDERVGKFHAWRSSAELLHDHRLAGVGRGAFEPAFTRVHPPSDARTYSHLENEYLQAVVDWGLPGACILALILIWSGLEAARRWSRSPSAVAALGALFAIALQSFVDFGLELPGIAIPTIAILATVNAVELRTKRIRSRTVVYFRRGAIVAGALVVAIAATPWGRSLGEDSARLAAMARDRDVDHKEALREANRLVRRHPADYYAPATAALILSREGDLTAVRYANRALTLHPTHPDVHRLVARTLVRAKRAEQARVEYSLAIRHSSNPEPVIREVLRMYSTKSDIARCFPRDRDHVARVLNILVRLGRKDIAVEYASKILQLWPKHVYTLRQLATLALDTGNFALAETAARQAQAIAPSAQGALALARVLRSTGRLSESTDELVNALGNAPSRAAEIDLRFSLANTYVARGEVWAAREQLVVVKELASDDRRALARAHRRMAQVERALGNTHRSQWEQQRADELSPP